MRGGVILLLIAVFIAYLGVSGKHQCFTKMLKCLAGKDDCNCNPSEKTAINTNITKPSIDVSIGLPPLPRLKDINVISS